LNILKKVDGSFEYGINNYTGELFVNTFGMIHLDKIIYDLTLTYELLYEKKLDFKISNPRFKFKESIRNTLDGERFDDKVGNIDNKFVSRVIVFENEN